ncbi:DRTGG domain-containing protein [Natranaerobius thermophilus]|uniref:DRTGG domain protein n=1 Tax=Natranaerobius thermophilus (strain ATCC BAA-1301 / DSM 18059 / JW/NM-WN-LF) TaxID=457570 RepID=B2A3R4_NATTJ|nr:DRTGG domain-containing protein [Natranaerobius thermophilus]ACB83690.1 DRTGG domain protein [Natranaerobius thermophilus JW/NM-WN-LF]
MKISQIKKILQADILTGKEENSVEVAFGTDLMSDVLAFFGESDNTLLLTGLTNLQVIRTAELLDINAIIFVRGKEPKDELIKEAEECGITLLSTDYTLYEASGLLFTHGLRGINTDDNLPESPERGLDHG